MSRKRNFAIFPIALILFAAFFLMNPGQVFAQDNEPVWERFSEFDPESTVKVNHNPLSEFLNGIVFPVGSSIKVIGTKGRTDKFTGSRIISTTSGVPSRYEGNRLMIHAFDDDHAAFLKGYKKGLERLSNRRPLAELNKDEQLAYWLNLYNVTVLNKLVEEYPVKKLKSWRVSKKQTPYWSKKVVTVEGIPLSLRDIELNLFNNWDSPLVMYGLFQGTIGGPSLSTEAFTGQGVWQILKENAEEFVNSNRGLKIKGARADVSLMYEWALPLFDNSNEQVLAHIQTYDNGGFHGGLSEVSSIRFKTYNWIIADLVGGTLHKGQHSQLGGVLTAGSGRDAAPPGGGEGGGDVSQGTSFNQLLNQFLGHEPTGAQLSLPVQALELMREILVHNNVPTRIPTVTIIDCQYEGGCEDVTPENVEEVQPDDPSGSKPSFAQD